MSTREPPPTGFTVSGTGLSRCAYPESPPEITGVAHAPRGLGSSLTQVGERSMVGPPAKKSVSSRSPRLPNRRSNRESPGASHPPLHSESSPPRWTLRTGRRSISACEIAQGREAIDMFAVGNTETAAPARSINQAHPATTVVGVASNHRQRSSTQMTLRQRSPFAGVHVRVDSSYSLSVPPPDQIPSVTKVVRYPKR
jgi:hypothetical protein